MPEPHGRGRPLPGPASENLTAPMQLDLTDEGTPQEADRVRTDPDPAERRRNLEEGRRRRDEGMTYAAANTPIGWSDLVKASIEEWAAKVVPFTVDNVRDDTGHPLGASPNAFGPPFMSAAKRGLIRKLGYQPSSRPERHGAPVALWIGTGAEDG